MKEEHVCTIISDVIMTVIRGSEWFLGGYDGLLLTLVILILARCFTDIIYNKYCKHEKTKEYWKGVLIFIVIGIAHILDQNIIIGLEAVLTLRACSIIFYISTEGTHVLTNMNALGVPFPKIIKDILDRLNDE